MNQNTYPVLRKFYRSQNFSCLKQGKGHETVFSGTEKLLVKVNFFVTQDFQKDVQEIKILFIPGPDLDLHG